MTVGPQQLLPLVKVQRRFKADRSHGAWTINGEFFDENRINAKPKLGAYDLDPVVDADLTQHVGIVILGNEPKGCWKAISALSQPVRIRQAIERTILPPDQWPTGAAVVNEVPYQENEVVEPVDLSRLPSWPHMKQ